MLKIGLVSAATYGYLDAPRTPGSFHGTAFATAFNGYDATKSQQYQWTFAAATSPLEGARVVKVWDPQKDWAERLADVCSIPEVCDHPDECSEGTDVVIIVDDGSATQADYAITPLRKGLPVFCDKPLALTGKRAKEIIDVAKETGTPFMSASSLRYVPGTLKLAEEAKSLGDIHLATAFCGNDLIYYGIHALELAYAVLGSGAVSCMNVGQPGRNIVRVRMECGRDIVLLVGMPEYMSAGFRLTLYTKSGRHTIEPDLTDLYVYLMQAFIDMVNSGAKFAVPLDEMVEVIATLEAGQRSLELGREVTVAEVLA